MEPKNMIMSVCEFDLQPQNRPGFWTVSSMGWVPEQECTVPQIFPGTLSG